MSRFDQYLESIGKDICIDDRDKMVFTEDYDLIRDHIMNLMRVDPVFNKIYKGTSLFGSYPNSVRINSPNEFDVHFKLEFPYPELLIVKPDKMRPGYVRLQFRQVIKKLETNPGHRDVLELLRSLVAGSKLCRNRLQHWLEVLITAGLARVGVFVSGSQNDRYKLTYSKRGLAHTIYAQSTARTMSIDLVPAIVNEAGSYALPKPTGGPKHSRIYAFQICHSKVEHDMLVGKYNLKPVYRLLKALRNKARMPRFKSYFLTTAFLFEVENQNEDFWQKPIGFLLVHMLDVLLNYLDAGEMPFFWAPDLDLLDILTDEEILDYEKKLERVYNALKTYDSQPELKLSTVRKHFSLKTEH